MVHFEKIMAGQNGFTLIELLITLVLIGAMSGIAISLVNPVTQFQRARDVQRKSDAARIRSALEIYKADRGIYPPALLVNNCGNSFSVGLTVYLAMIPCDPQPPSTSYKYSLVNSSDGYNLVICLERVDDPQRDSANGLPNTCALPRHSMTLTNP